MCNDQGGAGGLVQHNKPCWSGFRVTAEEVAAALIRIAWRLQNCNYQPGCLRCGKSGLHQRLTPCVPRSVRPHPQGVGSHARIPQQPPQGTLRPAGCRRQSSQARACKR